MITIQIHHYHHFPPEDGAVLDRLEKLTKQLTKMSASLDKLQSEIEENTSVVSSATALLTSLSAQIRELKDDPAALAKLADQLDKSNAALAEAVAANTPAEED